MIIEHKHFSFFERVLLLFSHHYALTVSDPIPIQKLCNPMHSRRASGISGQLQQTLLDIRMPRMFTKLISPARHRSTQIAILKTGMILYVLVLYCRVEIAGVEEKKQ